MYQAKPNQKREHNADWQSGVPDGVLKRLENSTQLRWCLILVLKDEEEIARKRGKGRDVLRGMSWKGKQRGQMHIDVRSEEWESQVAGTLSA